MTRILFSLVTFALIGCSNAFVPFSPHSKPSMALYSSLMDEEVVSEGNSDPKVEIEKPAVAAKPLKKKPVGGHNQDGLLAPFVILMKKVLGDDELNKLRGKVISLHSEVIGTFVDTHDSAVGEINSRTIWS